MRVAQKMSLNRIPPLPVSITKILMLVILSPPCWAPKYFLLFSYVSLQKKKKKKGRLEKAFLSLFPTMNKKQPLFPRLPFSPNGNRLNLQKVKCLPASKRWIRWTKVATIKPSRLKGQSKLSVRPESWTGREKIRCDSQKREREKTN